MTAAGQNSSPAAVTVVVVNFNGAQTLRPTLDSIFQQEQQPAEVLVVDNHSTDGSVALVREAYGDRVRVIGLPENRGPNPARNQGLVSAQNPLVLNMDNDIVLAPDYIRRLTAVFAEHPEAGAVSGQIRLHDQPDVIQYNGAFIHYAGEIVANRSDSEDPVVVGVVPTGAVMIRRAAAEAVGNLDEDVVFGWDDGDFTFRLTLAGTPCFVVSRALCYHMSRGRSLKWVRYQVRNRWWFILKMYDARTIVLALPGILFLQACAGVFFTLKGQLPGFLRGCLDVPLTLPLVLQKRRRFKPLKKVPDSRTLCGGPIELPGHVRASRTAFLARFVDAFLSGYWTLIRPMIR